jgi:glucose-1-phosphate adenylyltransferase
MGADFFSPAADERLDAVPLLGIGDGTMVEGSIIDKNCHIGRNVRIANDAGLTTSEETPEAMIAEGIMMIQKGAILPDGWRFEAK